MMKELRQQIQEFRKKALFLKLFAKHRDSITLMRLFWIAMISCIQTNTQFRDFIPKIKEDHKLL